MQSQKLDLNNLGTKKFYTSASSNISPNQKNRQLVMDQIYNIKSNGNINGNIATNSNNKVPRVRRTDHTDEIYSDLSSSRMKQQMQNGNGQNYSSNPRYSTQHIQVQQDGQQNQATESRYSKNNNKNTNNHNKNMSSQAYYNNNNGGHIINGFMYLSEKQQTIIELRERLKNIHHFYRIRIQEERSKNIERNQIFISVIQQLQKHHNDKILNLQKTFDELQAQKNQISLVDERMGSIKSTIEDVLKQSQDLKQNNQKLQKQILQKQVNNKQKQSNLIQMKEELNQFRERLQHFERLKLKENKRNKDLLQIIEQGASVS